MTETVSYTAAFLAGLLSFFSPCILPLIPAYFTFITGYSLEQLTGQPAAIRRQVMVSTAAYVAGFSLVFILMGASASFVGGFFRDHSGWIRIVGGSLIVLLGLHLTGWIRLPGLDVEKRIHLQRKPLHFFGTFVVGMAFGAGWSPCIGPLLGSILIIAGNQQSVAQGVILLGLYSAGLALPFLVISVFINFVLVFLRRAVRAIRVLNVAAGILLMAIGLVLITNKLNLVLRFLPV